MTTKDLFTILAPLKPKLQSGQVVVKCPACHHRGKTEDKSGHLRLNAGINAGHCVRCGYSIGTGKLLAWLRKNGYDVVYDGTELDDVCVTPDESNPFQVATMPSNTGLAHKRSAAPLLDKGLTNAEIEFWDVRLITKGYEDMGSFKTPNLQGWHLFPIKEGGEICYWHARNPMGGEFRSYYPPFKLGKSRWLFGLDECPIGGTIFIVEGVLDAISTFSAIKQEGLNAGVVALGGTSMSMPTDLQPELWSSQLGKLIIMNPSNVVVMLDGDASISASMIASSVEPHFPVSVIQLPHSYDPNEMWRHYPEKLRTAIRNMQATPLDFES
jgi:hypothetical protein